MPKSRHGARGRGNKRLSVGIMVKAGPYPYNINPRRAARLLVDPTSQLQQSHGWHVKESTSEYYSSAKTIEGLTITMVHIARSEIGVLRFIV